MVTHQREGGTGLQPIPLNRSEGYVSYYSSSVLRFLLKIAQELAGRTRQGGEGGGVWAPVAQFKLLKTTRPPGGAATRRSLGPRGHNPNYSHYSAPRGRCCHLEGVVWPPGGTIQTTQTTPPPGGGCCHLVVGRIQALSAE